MSGKILGKTNDNECHSENPSFFRRIVNSTLTDLIFLRLQSFFHQLHGFSIANLHQIHAFR
jgi:hypothetical protein